MKSLKMTWRQILELIIAMLQILQGYVPEKPSKAIARKSANFKI